MADAAIIASSFFFINTPRHAPNAPVLICPLLDEKGHRQGVFAQLLHNAPPQYPANEDVTRDESSAAPSESPLPMPRKNNVSHKDPEEMLSKISRSGAQGDWVDAKSMQGRLDSKQTQLFQRFAELLPTGLAILDHNVSSLFPALLRNPVSEKGISNVSR